MHKISKKNICEILNFSRSQLSFRARKKRSVGSWCPTYIFLLPKRYINNLQQELGQKLLKPWRKIIFYAKKELFLSFPANPTLKSRIRWEGKEYLLVFLHTFLCIWSTYFDPLKTNDTSLDQAGANSRNRNAQHYVLCQCQPVFKTGAACWF